MPKNKEISPPQENKRRTEIHHRYDNLLLTPRANIEINIVCSSRSSEHTTWTRFSRETVEVRGGVTSKSSKQNKITRIRSSHREPYRSTFQKTFYFVPVGVISLGHCDLGSGICLLINKLLSTRKSPSPHPTMKGLDNTSPWSHSGF